MVWKIFHITRLIGKNPVTSLSAVEFCYNQTPVFEANITNNLYLKQIVCFLIRLDLCVLSFGHPKLNDMNSQRGDGDLVSMVRTKSWQEVENCFKLFTI